MRALVISDIHSNLQAFQAVLAAAPPHDAVWNLGDVVGYGANPNEVVDLARRLGGVVVRGNHDRACSDPAKFSLNHSINPMAATAAIWMDMVLTNESREWLSELPCGPLKPFKRSPACVHGSPRNEDDYVASEYQAKVALTGSKTRITLFGHTHEQIGWISIRRGIYPVKPAWPNLGAVQFHLPLRRNIRYLLNPRSVGQTRDGDWRAAFAIYDDTKQKFTWYRVPYKVRAAQRRILRVGLPEFLATRLRDGT